MKSLRLMPLLAVLALMGCADTDAPTAPSLPMTSPAMICLGVWNVAAQRCDKIEDRVVFGKASAHLTAAARAVLDQQAVWLERYPNINVTIDAYAADYASMARNLSLAEQRAKTVKKYLVRRGTDAERIGIHPCVGAESAKDSCAPVLAQQEPALRSAVTVPVPGGVPLSPQLPRSR